MGIENFPTALQPIIQQGLLAKAFEKALRSKLAYRSIADRENFQARIGDSITRTRAGLLPSVTTPLSPASNTNLDNGLTPDNWAVEQYTVVLNQYAATQDLNMVTSRTAMASVFAQNAYTSGEQARRSLDELARNALFASYFSGNTRVTTTLGAAGATIAVDDVRGFQYVPGWNSQSQPTGGAQSPTWVPVSGTNTLLCTVGSDTYTLTGVTVDGSNTSTTPGGISGTLTFSTSVTVANGTAGNTVQASNSAVMERPNARGNTSLLQAADTLTMSTLLNSVASLRANAVPEIGGVYHCYLDPVSSRQLFSDPDFKQLFLGGINTAEYREGELISPFLGLRFIPTTEAYVTSHPTIAGLKVRRPIICGQGALIEGDFDGMAAEDIRPKDSIVDMVDDICMVVREPIDRLQQIIAQSWYWIGGFAVPSDVTTTTTTVPTATNSAYKRAVIVEHVG
ncbi:MAG TPA: DUF4043 domain-containing protein [Acidocella sp.]|nr:DUF4043 domain-containing protein [Acidocella sp.]